MRGKDPRPCPAGCRVGITPAYAGKSPLRRRSSPSGRDHPRVCGEKQGQKDSILNRLGSPPRMRGKAMAGAPQGGLAGITPAYAGKSRIRAGHWAASGDHPRVCGEKLGLAWSIAGVAGSPPRMRGKAPPLINSLTIVGITPAYAGKSWHFIMNNKSDRDHPRVCGEKHQYQCDGCWDKGITPAYAGKSEPGTQGLRKERDHPRMCGEK